MVRRYSLSSASGRPRTSVVAAVVAMSTVLAAQAPRVAPNQPGKPIAIVGGLLVDGTGSRPRLDQTVLIRGDRIVQVGPSDQVAVPPDAEVLDAAGLTVMPGLINSNQHLQ